jgi:gamma-glutamyl-gamma-aminobutyrate hydrolase PuuD
MDRYSGSVILPFSAVDPRRVDACYAATRKGAGAAASLDEVVPGTSTSAPAVDVSVPPAQVEPEPQPEGPTAEDIVQGAQQSEAVWREQLPEGQSRCRVGITVNDNVAMFGAQSWVDAYAQGVVAAGGEPVLIFPSRGKYNEQLAQVDALLVPGGLDVEPVYYNAERGPGMTYSPTNSKQDAFELSCLRHAYQKRLPVLGICRGQQLMNVAGGGTLIQDIPSEHSPQSTWQVAHRPYVADPYQPSHPIAITEGSLLHALLGTGEVMVNSVHHQAVGNLSPLFKVTAVAMDNIVEAIERKDEPTQSAVQFHPEQLRRQDGRFQALFERLVGDGVHYHQAHDGGAPPPPAAPQPSRGMRLLKRLGLAY